MGQRSSPSSLLAIAAILAGTAFVLNFAWEMLQAPWFAGMSGLDWWTSTPICLQGTIGDVAMILLAFYVVGAATGDRVWLLRSAKPPLAAFMGLAALQALSLEGLSVRLGRWAYLPSMPVDPILGLGLAPILQWLVIPATSAAIARHLALRRGLRPPAASR